MANAPSWTWVPWNDVTRDALHAFARLRQEVFVVEQDCAYLDLDGLDPRAWHLLGHLDGKLVAYVRVFAPGELRAEAVIGRVIVSPEARGLGLGRAVMIEGQRRVEATWGEAPIHLGAQKYLLRFYTSLGYDVTGPEYDEDGIPHLPMCRRP